MPDLGCGGQASIDSTGTENKASLQWTHVTTLLTERKCSLAARRGRRFRQLPDDLNETKEYWILKEEAIVRSLWINHFGKGNGPVVTENMEVKTNYGIKREGAEYATPQTVLTQIVFHIELRMTLYLKVH